MTTTEVPQPEFQSLAQKAADILKATYEDGQTPNDREVIANLKSELEQAYERIKNQQNALSRLRHLVTRLENLILRAMQGTKPAEEFTDTELSALSRLLNDTHQKESEIKND